MKTNIPLSENAMLNESEDNFMLEMENFLSEFDSEWQEPYTISGDVADAYKNTIF